MCGIVGIHSRDVDGANIQANQNVFVAPAGGFAGGSAFLNEKQNWLASIRGRIGYTWGPGMIYVTGGGAWTGVELNGGATLFTGGTGTFTTSSTQSGYVLGAGYECTRHLKATAGYNFSYATNLFRAADTVDTRVNPTE